ncbi:MAG: SAVED domain-containing protein [Kineosporiaceae bacterium]|nr:SAVED domain-containing protein [Kineosporiaceae bacterium]
MQVVVWAKSAGRCALCSAYLLNGRSWFHTILDGEMAHNVGASTGGGSPRSASHKTATERAEESNLLLLCHRCHREVDTPALADFYTIEYLTERKRAHEDRVRQVTDFATRRQTVIVSTKARIRQSTVTVSPRELAAALHSADLTPYTDAGEVFHICVELDDDETEPWVWARSTARIDEKLERLERAVASGRVDHLAVFAIAPIPILAHLGSRLDDKLAVVLFGRHRVDSDEAWCWRKESAQPEVRFTVSGDDVGDADEVVALVSVSAPVSEHRVPEALAGLPIIRLFPHDQAASRDLISSRTALAAFSDGWRRLLNTVEADFPNTRRIHVLAAVPTTVAVEMGRHRMREAQPRLAVYQRTEDGYAYALDVG